ncbi:MAG TPA: cation transporter [Thiomicrospira sp.]|jgi:multicomponent Na+:H+ antiporter subunit E|nr:cation transporter [Thiomicrospira sp.]
MVIPAVLSSIIFRGFIYSLIWWLLVDGAVSSWIIGVPIVLLATFISIKLLPVIPMSLIGTLKFIPFFLWHSLLGGFDAAKRVFYAKIAISPTIFNYSWRLPAGLSRVFMAKVVSLLPGTLAVELEGEFLQIHALDDSVDFTKELILVENKVAEMLKLNLSVNKK